MNSVLCRKIALLCVVFIVGAVRDDLRSNVYFLSEPVVSRQESDETSKTFDEVFITSPTHSCHSSSITPLPDGKMFVTWYGGSREGAKDVNIYSTTVDKSGKTNTIRSILDPATLGRQTKRYIRKLGNPVVYLQGDRLWIFVVSVSFGGWSGSSLNYAYSDDYGISWSKFRHLRTTPLLNLGTLVRCPAIPLRDEGFILPAYREFLGKFGVGVRFDADGNMIERVKIISEGNRSSIQPCFVPLGARRAMAFSRTPNRKISVSEMRNGWTSWKALPDLLLDNPDSSVAAFSINRDKIVIVGNPKEGRNSLRVWMSDSSDREQWREIARLEDSEDGEFSYPFVCRIDSNMYVSYTYRRRAIKIVNLTKIIDSACAKSDR